MQTFIDHQDQTDEVLADVMSVVALRHKQAIVKELNKRQEKKKEEMKRKREEEEDRRKRKDRRNALRERKRLEQLQDQIQREIVQAARHEEFSAKLKIYDVRDPNHVDDGVVIIGGFVGEIIITFTCLLDYILASPQNQNFFFSADAVEQYLTDLLGNEEMGFPDGTCCLKLMRDVKELTGGKDLPSEHVARLAREPSVIADFGLKFLFDIQKDLVLSTDVIDVVYKAICRIALRKHHPIKEMPTAPEDADDAAKEKVAEDAELIKTQNEASAAENEKNPEDSSQDLH